jgi:hypothetical protein
MNTSKPPATETALNREIRFFKELSPRLFDALLNRLFDLRPEKARNRLFYLLFLFVISGFVISLIVIPKDSDTYRSFQALLDGNFTFDTFLLTIWNLYTDPHTFQYLPIILASFFIALHAAALYLDDIFEINDVSVARRFIMEVALTGSDDTIRITNGEISDESRSSPNYLIGGPGKVIVDLDSVALFEQPDGTPRVIGPTGKEKGGKATLDGFERFRQAIDIRDHYVDLRDQDSKSGSVKSRSLDGIPITATDVRLMFSVHRNDKKSSVEAPYPYNEKAIEKLVYNAGSKVTPEQSNPSAFEFSWINNMVSLIRGKLGGFMGERNLTVYLASIGQPEIDKAKEREELLAQQERQITPPAANVQKKDFKQPDFVARYKITDLFAQFADEFTKSTRDRGVELHWIGVGTWNVPVEIVPETKVIPRKHLDAWEMSRENLKKGNKEALDNLEKETMLLKRMWLIQDVPIQSYNNKVVDAPDKKTAMRNLLLDYRQQLIEVAELMKANGEAISLGIKKAIENIDSVLGLHWVGGGGTTPRPPETNYQELIRLVGGDQSTADRLIEFERSQFPGESREQLIERAIERLIRDRN